MQNRKTYELSLTTLAPVHIGGNKTYTQKEYIYENDEYYFPDMDKLYSHICSLDSGLMNDFEDFLLDKGRYRYKRGAGARLINFLDNNRIKERNFGGYRIEGLGLEDPRSNYKNRSRPANINVVSAFVKDGLNRPYIPGSSLKGAIRTILVNTYFKQKYPKDTDKRIKWGGVSDIFHNIRVADEITFSPEDLVLVRKWDYSKRRNREKENPIPLYRESLRHNHPLCFNITCEGEEACFLIKNLEGYAKEHYRAYYNKFLKFLNDNYITTLSNTDRDALDSYLYLGAGTGFWTKSMLHDFKKPRGHGRMRMIGDGVHKLTKLSNRNTENYFVEMGKCRFEIKEK